MKRRLTEIPDSEMQARVAIQVVRRRLADLPGTTIPPSSIVYSAAYLLPHTGFAALRFALHSLAVHLDMGYSSSEWLKGVAYRAAFGGVFRWHFFAEYKSSRKPYPRVTNRGVHSAQPATLPGHEDEGDDA